MAVLLKGALAASAITQRAKERADALAAAGITPALAIIRMGEREDDMAYERGAIKRCAQAGVQVRQLTLPENAPQQKLLSLIESLNRDETVHGVLIMRPLPKGIDDAAVVAALSPEKDVDGITAGSMAAVYSGRGEGFAPCTAQACVELLKAYDIELSGKRAVVVGRSLVIGKPLAMLLLAENMTVTVCHTKTRELSKLCREADLLVAAAGKAGVLGKESVSPSQTVLDVGIHVGADGALCGDVRTGEVCDTVGAITPVPGGVGAVTTAVLAEHVVCSANRAKERGVEK